MKRIVAGSVIRDFSSLARGRKSLKAAPLKEKSVSERVTDLVKLAASAYVIGFAVILVHTIRLNGPVIEALQFQNIIAGLPVWAALMICVWLWPKFGNRIVKESEGKGPLPIWQFAVFAFEIAIGAVFLYYFLRFVIQRLFTASKMSFWSSR